MATIASAARGGLNQPERVPPVVARLQAAAAKTGRDVGALILLMIIADATDELAMAKWEHYKAGTDLEALAWQRTQASADTNASKESTVGQMIERQKAEPTPIPTGMLKLIGSYATVARMMDQVAAVPGVSGILMTFDDFVHRHGAIRPIHPAADDKPPAGCHRGVTRHARHCP